MMTKDQRKYAMDRIDGIVRAKREAVVKKHTAPHQYVQCSNLCYKSTGESLPDGLTPVYIPGKTDKAAIEARMAGVIQRATFIKDSLMLGDAAEALKALQEFEKACMYD